MIRVVIAQKKEVSLQDRKKREVTLGETLKIIGKERALFQKVRDIIEQQNKVIIKNWL